MAVHPTAGFIVRARQRSRTALKAFAPALAGLASDVGGLQIRDIGVDRLQVRVGGTWRTFNGPDRQDAASQFAENIFTALPVDWFTVQIGQGANRKITLRARQTSLLGSAEFTITGLTGRTRPALTATMTVNPSRALAHLLASYGSETNFLETIASLPWHDFFSRSNVAIQQGLGGSDNWIEDVDLCQSHLGVDPFTSFMPVFVEQLQRMVAAIYSHGEAVAFRSDGSDIVIYDEIAETRIHWGGVKVPQIECYFERHHARAIGAVRTAAMSALAGQDQCVVANYGTAIRYGINRENDCFSISLPVTDGVKLRIYAKAATRIRFEVERHGKGIYSSLEHPSQPAARLVDIVTLERRNAVHRTEWNAVGRLFDEPNTPSLSDLAGLCTTIADTCAQFSIDAATLLRPLLLDGGISVDHSIEQTDSDLAGAIGSLMQLGVLKRTVLRRRDHRRPMKRYDLTAMYRTVVERAAYALTVPYPGG